MSTQSQDQEASSSSQQHAQEDQSINISRYTFAFHPPFEMSDFDPDLMLIFLAPGLLSPTVQG